MVVDPNEPPIVPTDEAPTEIPQPPRMRALTAAEVRGVLQFTEGWLWGAMHESASEHVREYMEQMVEIYLKDCNP